MTKLSNALGSAYESKRSDLLIGKFEYGGHTFKVRIPLIAESDAIYQLITNPDRPRVDEIFSQLTAPLLQFKDVADSGFVFTEDDVLVNSQSMREAAKSKAMTEIRITSYIRLLIGDGSLVDITYPEIEAEWPLSVQLGICERIGEVISPSYKESRGN